MRAPPKHTREAQVPSESDSYVTPIFDRAALHARLAGETSDVGRTATVGSSRKFCTGGWSGGVRESPGGRTDIDRGISPSLRTAGSPLGSYAADRSGAKSRSPQRLEIPQSAVGRSSAARSGSKSRRPQRAEEN